MSPNKVSPTVPLGHSIIDISTDKINKANFFDAFGKGIMHLFFCFLFLGSEWYKCLEESGDPLQDLSFLQTI